MGGGLKPNSNVPIVDVPKWLRRGGVRPNWDNVLKYGFFLKASPREFPTHTNISGVRFWLGLVNQVGEFERIDSAMEILNHTRPRKDT